MPHTVYILKCCDGSFYTGCTNDLEKIIKQHNESKLGAHYTKIRRPVALIHSETFKTLKEARHREAEIKKMSKVEKIALINDKKIQK